MATTIFLTICEAAPKKRSSTPDDALHLYGIVKYLVCHVDCLLDDLDAMNHAVALIGTNKSNLIAVAR